MPDMKLKTSPRDEEPGTPQEIAGSGPVRAGIPSPKPEPDGETAERGRNEPGDLAEPGVVEEPQQARRPAEAGGVARAARRGAEDPSQAVVAEDEVQHGARRAAPDERPLAAGMRATIATHQPPVTSTVTRATRRPRSRRRTGVSAATGTRGRSPAGPGTPGGTWSGRRTRRRWAARITQRSPPCSSARSSAHAPVTRRRVSRASGLL